MACPICLDVADQSLATGLRAGALVLIVVAAVVIVGLVRFALGLRARERALAAQGGNESPVGDTTTGQAVSRSGASAG